VRGVALLDRVKDSFGWSDRQLARALGVSPGVVSRYWRIGVPDYQACRLRRLSRSPAEGAVASPPRRRR
jgi:transcriptional regulator with XRE-family HTH domain